MWVVKLGGSLLGSSELVNWLNLFSRQSQIPLTIVTGGGAFADAIRIAQGKLPFDDDLAHDMAVLAMEQSARFCHAVQPKLGLADSIDELTSIHAEGRNAILIPAKLLEKDTSLAKNWQLTSDSLAAWFASKLDASGIVLIKSCQILQHDELGTELMQAGIVDEMFPAMMQGFRGRLLCFSSSQSRQFQQALNQGTAVGQRQPQMSVP